MTLIQGKKRVFVVLGMSRSGTSTIARALKTLKIDLGDYLISAKSINPTGVFEDADILYKVNRGVSALLGNPWISTHLFDKEPLENIKSLREYKEYAVKLLQKRFANTQNWGFKDPRTIAILPFWQSVFAAIDVDDSYVITMRNPLASAHSNQKFAKIDIEEGLLLWLMILISAIDGTQGKKRVLVSYEAMLTNPRQQLERMQRDLDIPFTSDPQQIDEYADDFLDTNLRHYTASDDELKAHPAVTIVPLCLRVNELLLKVANDEIHLNSDEFKLAWSDIKDEFASIYPAYSYIKKLLVRNRELQKEIRIIQKSFLWKILAPIRIVSDVFHVQKCKRNDKKRLSKIYG